MINIIDKISKETDAKEVSRLIIDTVMDDRIENMTNDEWKFVTKSMIFATRAFADKGLKSKAHMLAQEYFSQEDLDGDNLIYGIDFVYDNPPDILKEITRNTRDIVDIIILPWEPIRKETRKW